MQLVNSNSCSKLHRIDDPTVECYSAWHGKSINIKMAIINILQGQRPGSAEALKICEVR